LVTYAIAGTVNAITDQSTTHYVPTAIAKGQPFVGTFSYDNSAPGTLDGSNGYYTGTALNLSLDIVIDGQYAYALSTPSSSDEIDILGTSFGVYKRGPVVSTGFSSSTPFSHFDFFGAITQTNILANAQVGVGPTTYSGVGDTEANLYPPYDPYYYVEAHISSVTQVTPEPATLALLAVAAASLLGCKWRRGRGG
jgi:hypothetical protein